MTTRRARPFHASAEPLSAPGKPPVARRDFLARTAAALGAGLLAFAGRPALAGGEQARAATTGSSPVIGEIMMFAGAFAPRGWADCNGQLLPIAEHTTLFSLLGTTYGGDGQTTFALPDLRGRVPIHLGQGPGLSPYTLGQMGGAEAVALSIGELPAHTHALRVDTAVGSSAAPNGAELARDSVGSPARGEDVGGARATAAVATVGASQPHENLPPYTAIRYCIALEGIHPAQSGAVDQS